VDGINAVVGERVVTFAEVQDYTHLAAEALARQYAGQPDVFQQKLDAALNDGLEQLVERDLILHSFDTDGYKLPDSAVDDLMAERIRKGGDRVTLMKTLQAEGMTYEQFRRQVREQYIESAMRNLNIQREIIISPYKVENYYETHLTDFNVDDQVKLRMIVLNKTSAVDTNALALAREIITSIKGGASFAQMATVYSQGSQQQQGGEWGWYKTSELRKEFGNAAQTLKPGQMSDPIDTPDAVYLMLLEDKMAAHAKPLADVRADIEKTLRVQQQSQLEKQWIDGLKKKTFIRYFK
ncbi:MAG TPA: peptidylprolyl isomerase, partial [Verrucomicrobiae bacterium]